MKYCTLFLLMLCLSQHFVNAQSEQKFYCPTDELNKTIPDFNEKQNEFNQAYSESVKNKLIGETLTKQNTLKTIPVVVHVIHAGTPLGSITNPTDEFIISKIEEVTQRFRHTHDGAQSYTNSYYGVDSEIELCLASANPNGNYTSGITRHYLPLQAVGSDIYLESQLESLLWDTDLYCNIFLVSDILYSAAAFYSYINDFIALEASSFNANIITHELGHYLSLVHTFSNGCGNDDCLLNGDFVCDTPPVDSPNYDCIDVINTCMTDEDDTSLENPYRPIALGGMGEQPDMLENYMDYTQSCTDAFTQGQKDRMHFNIENNRNSLIGNISACAPVSNYFDVGISSIYLDYDGICDSVVIPNFILRNYGTSFINSAMIDISINDLLVESGTWSGLLFGGDSILLSFNNSIVLPETGSLIKIEAYNPSGLTDSNFYNNTNYALANYFGDGIQLPQNESFNYCIVPMTWMNDPEWIIEVQEDSWECQACAISLIPQNLFIEDSTTDISLVSPLYDFTDLSNINLSFKIGHIPRYDVLFDDELRIEVSVGCNAPSSTVVWSAKGLNLGTNDPRIYSDGVFLFPDCSEFLTKSIDLSAYAGMQEVQIKFIANGRWWSPLLIDNIELLAYSNDCQNTYVIDNVPILDGTYQANQNLYSSGKVINGNTVKLQAVNSVNLEIGFSSELGSELEISIEPCN